MSQFKSELLQTIMETVGTPVAKLFIWSFASYYVFHKYEPYGKISLVILLLLVPGTASALHHLAVTATIASLVSYWALLLLFTFLYRISPFHPLARYPEPFINRVTKFTLAWQAWNKSLHRDIRDLHQRYGDIVRTGPNQLSYCNVDGVESILNTLPKGSYYSNMVSSIVVEVDPKRHSQLRRPWNRSLNGPSLKDYDQVVTENARQLVDELDKRRAGQVDISMWMSLFAFDFTGNMAFSFSFDTMKEGRDSKGYLDAVSSQLQFGSLISQIPWAGKLFFNLRESKIYLMAQELIRHRMKAGSNTRDLIYHLNNEDGKQAEGPPPIQLFSDGVTAIIAGSGTVSTALTNVWYYLLRAPDCYKRLREEVDAHFPQGEEPLDQERLAAMPYLNACINEAMRLQSPIPCGSQRTALKGGCVVGSNFISEGTNIALNTFALQRDPRYFSPYPDTYWPDRWLEPENRRSLEDVTKPLAPTIQVVLNKTAFLPFSAGSRNCVGRNVGMNEMRAVTPSIVQRFDMKVAPGYDLDGWEDSLSDAFSMFKNSPLPVILTERV
jgi:cytochrome P450